ncbi:MAG: hypothetical protein COB90_03035 [Hyphomicrobiales bacterium]|nr:MAG: hypothetical protein COB90_03035 [Hyphomicrobiales bacterium]
MRDTDVLVLDCLSILIIEDSENMSTLLRAMLQAFGARRISSTLTADTSADDLYHFRPDIIIMDWYLNSLRASEFMRKLRHKDNPHAGIPVIAITAETRKSVVIDALSFGVDNIMSKPLSAQSLYDRLLILVTEDRKIIRINDYVGPLTPAHRAMVAREIMDQVQRLASEEDGEYSDDTQSVTIAI